MALDKWAWDRKHIKLYREIHEPYDSYERLMMEKAVSPYWIEMWASQGTVEKRVLPSGLTILIKRGEGKFEEYVLTDTGEVLDFNHEPKHYRVKKPLVITPELIAVAGIKLAELKKRGWRRKWRNG